MVEVPRVLPLCEMGLGVQILGFKMEDNLMAYCWNCLCIPSDIATIRGHLSGTNAYSDDFHDPSFYKSLQRKRRPDSGGSGYDQGLESFPSLQGASKRANTWV